MQRARAADRHPISGPLERRGTARSARVTGDPPRTLFRFDDEPTAARLVELGGAGAGGFFAGGLDDDGPWAVRREPETTLGSVLKREGREPLAWKRAVTICLAAAEALAASEKAGVVLGLFGPDSIALAPGDEGEPERIWVQGEALFDVAIGIADERTLAAKSAHYCPPTQAEGAPWDAGADRYVLGLCLYRALAGSHPFAGAGLRKALEAAATREPPPFPDAIAGGLPAGLMGLVLRMIAPAEIDRPASAEAIADALSRFVPKRGAALLPAPPRRARTTNDGRRESAAGPAPTLV
ncbi:MAG TPA: hypothetical protein VL400_22080, partial [Polyangiaceae bacterium]|nr:hypothetical protein [Polyangiaceae bacterium]